MRSWIVIGWLNRGVKSFRRALFARFHVQRFIQFSDDLRDGVGFDEAPVEFLTLAVGNCDDVLAHFSSPPSSCVSAASSTRPSSMITEHSLPFPTLSTQHCAPCSSASSASSYMPSSSSRLPSRIRSTFNFGFIAIPTATDTRSCSALDAWANGVSLKSTPISSKDSPSTGNLARWI